MTDSDILWFVMRDLTHYHSKSPAYKMLDGLKIENFTPKVQKRKCLPSNTVSCVTGNGPP